MNLRGDYLVPKRSGTVCVGTTQEMVGFDNSTTREARRHLQRFVETYVSRAEGADIVEQTACLRPMSPDDSPIMGTLPAYSGAYVATGHGRSGILLSTGTGKAMAELITAGKSECLNLASFTPARFGR